MKRRPFRTRLGMDGYCRMYVRLLRGATVHQLKEEGYASGSSTAHRFLASLHKLGRVRIKGWETPPGRRARAIWIADSGQDVEPPEITASGSKLSGAFIPTVTKILPELLGFDLLLTSLERPVTRLQIKQETGLDEITIISGLTALMPKAAHYAGTTRVSRKNSAKAELFCLGPGPDRSARVYTRMTKAEINARWRARVKAAATPMSNVAATLAANHERSAA